jgi:hypothetical protein
MRIAGLLAVILVLSSHPAVAVKRHASIPEPLRVSWAPSAEDLGRKYEQGDELLQRREECIETFVALANR